MQVSKVPGTQHPVLYAAAGSHGLWLTAGSHNYADVEIEALSNLYIESLYDHCAAGKAWDTWNNVIAFDYYDPSTNSGRGLSGSQWPNWMRDDFTEPGECEDETDPTCGAIFRWGNPYWKCSIAGISLGGYCVLENGPKGAVSKPVMTSETLQ
jgi:hypothetical protein